MLNNTEHIFYTINIKNTFNIRYILTEQILNIEQFFYSGNKSLKIKKIKACLTGRLLFFLNYPKYRSTSSSESPIYLSGVKSFSLTFSLFGISNVSTKA